MSDDVTGHGTNQPSQRPMWQVQPGPVTGPFSSPPTPSEGQPGQRIAQPADGHSQHHSPSAQGYPQQGQQPYQAYEPPYEQLGQQGTHQQQAQRQGLLQAQQQGQQPPTDDYQGRRAAYASPTESERAMTAQDFLAHRHRTLDIGPATWGWRGRLRRMTFGLVKPKMGKAEREYREARAVVQRSFSGPRTIVFANPKGGAAKTTSVLAAGYTFGTIRGGGVVAWDNNETRGTLGIRGERANHQNTTRELLDDLQRFQDVYESRIGDLGAFVRSQGDAHFDVLASDERADVTGQIKASDFGAVHRLLERFYHLILVDTGNNLRAENWLAAAQTADLIVVTCTVREDTGYSGLWMLDALEDAGHHDLKEKTITVLADPSANVDAQLAKDLVEVYEQRTRAVFRVPYDPGLVAGSVIQYGQLSEATTAAWLKACAAMAAAL